MHPLIKLLIPFLLAIGLSLLIIGCADERTPPVAVNAPANTETIVLWQNAVSDGDTVSAQFTVRDTLAPITRVGLDAPARLFLWAFIEPNSDVLWREAIMDDSLPPMTDRGIDYQVLLDRFGKVQDSLFFIEQHADSFAFDSTECDSPSFTIIEGDTLWCDSILFRMYPDSMFYDTTGLAVHQAENDSLVLVYTNLNTTLGRDSTLMGLRRDSLGYLLDDRFSLAIWLDDATALAYPEAVYNDTLLTADTLLLSGQYIYRAVTDTLTGLKGRGFELNLSSFEGAARSTPYHTTEFVWTCNPGMTRCLYPGIHTLHARLNGGHTRITGSIVLVYEELLP
jgi:hypothetical protein